MKRERLQLMHCSDLYRLDGIGEKDQRIVSLTAQLTTARMKEAVSERR